MASATAEQQQQTKERPTNRLAREKSPYLLQHAHNPVDWFPWGEEAFEKARRENKPIFLSIGYATCHWCHVMERESFESEEIAAILNSKYVPIKVDREERPDVDRVYMTFVQATTGSGGWPMSVWLTPELKPFVGGTYFPPQDAFRRPGFASILKSLARRWETDKSQLVAAGDQVFVALKDFVAKRDTEAPAISTPQGTAEKCYAMFLQRFDSQFGGWNEEGPKFPTPPIMHFLLRYFAMEYSRLASFEMLSQLSEEELEHRLSNAGVNQRNFSTKDDLLRAYKGHLDDHNEEVQPALDMVLQTLTKMARGGIRDHVGNGFHRYSTDREWHVPHFEKMLYDQAQLAAIYIDAFTVSRNPFFAQIADDIFTYVLRDLRHPYGGFYSAEDADSLPSANDTNKKEGAFCVWTANELRELLGLRKADIFGFHYGVQEGGNVDPRGDPHGELRGKNVLLERRTLDETARHAGCSMEEAAQLLADCRAFLWQVRQQQRPRPSLDNKIVTSWNGLMITALARGFQALGKKEYLDAAIQTVNFIRSEMFDANTGQLYRSYCDGPSATLGFVDDYSFFIQGLLDLFEACFDPQYLAWAEQLQRKQDELFWDAKDAGYFSVSEQDPSILLRMKEDHDGAEPSPNSIATMNLFRLGNFLADSTLEDRARLLIAHFDGLLQRAPISMPSLVAASLAIFKGGQQVTICGPLDHPDTQALLAVIHSQLLPRKALLVLPVSRHDAFSFLYERNPTARQYQMIDQRPTVYVCRDFTCQQPCHDPAQLDLLLSEVEG